MKEGKFEPEAYVFKSWTYYPSDGIIEYQQKELILEPRLAKLMTSLLDQKRIAKREVLIKEIWPDTIVNDESLNRAVADLRKKLNNFFPNPPEIETIPKVGYRIHVSESTPPTSLGKRLAKLSAYVLLGVLLMIILIRAIRY